MAPKTNGLQDRRPEARVARMEAPRDAQPSGSDGGTAAKSSAGPFVEQQPLGPDVKLEQICDWCNKPFAPRGGTGGTKQKFCSRDCQRTSNRERQRTQRRAAYVALATLPATGQPTSNETLPREPAVAPLHPRETDVLDIANSERIEFAVALKDGETARTRIETWPAEVRALMNQHVTRWVEDHKDTRIVRAMTVGAAKYDGVQSCVLILHHSPKHDAVPGYSSEGKAVLAGRRGVS
jgi:hypothetical protein